MSCVIHRTPPCFPRCFLLHFDLRLNPDFRLIPAQIKDVFFLPSLRESVCSANSGCCWAWNEAFIVRNSLTKSGAKLLCLSVSSLLVRPCSLCFDLCEEERRVVGIWGWSRPVPRWAQLLLVISSHQRGKLLKEHLYYLPLQRGFKYGHAHTHKSGVYIYRQHFKIRVQNICLSNAKLYDGLNQDLSVVHHK